MGLGRERVKGGLDLPDFEIMNNAPKVTWLKRLHESCGNTSWSHIPLSLFKEVGGLFLFECNYDLKCLKVLWIAETFSIMASTCMACCLFEDIVGMI